ADAAQRGRGRGNPGVLRQARGAVQGPVMDLGVRGKVALVTGGARSLGKADCLALAAEGCKIAVLDLDPEGAEVAAKEIVAAGGVARGYGGDLRDPVQVTAAVAALERDLGPVDICVNNAGLIYTVGQDRKSTRLNSSHT